jgi:ComF family protein
LPIRRGTPDAFSESRGRPDGRDQPGRIAPLRFFSTEETVESRRRKLNQIARALVDFLLPSLCLACERRHVERLLRGGVCDECWDSLPLPAQSRCARCAEELGLPEAEALCGRCLLEPPPFVALCAAAPYRGAARDILVAFKFRQADFLAPHLAEVMSGRIGLPEAVREVVAVPATPRARWRRGFHPADCLGRAVAPRVGLPFAAGRLEKVRETRVQSELPARERPANVHGAFRVRGRPGRHILLVDDVATSGATARECARVLGAAGAEAVTVWCFARASRDSSRFEVLSSTFESPLPSPLPRTENTSTEN